MLMDIIPSLILQAVAKSIKQCVGSTTECNIQKHMLLLQSKLGISAYEYEF